MVGRITGMVDCRWADPATEAFDRDDVPLGRKYALASGFMEITYNSGAKVILQGPATYEVESASGGFLSLGKLTARVEKKGQGPGVRIRVEGRANRQPNPLPNGEGTNHFARPSPLVANPKSEIRNPISIPNP